MDVFAACEGSDVRAILEVKATDWDRKTAEAVRRNVNRQAAQIWRYIEMHPTVDGICPGIAFPKRPRSAARLKLVEALFEAYGIPVVWYDESLAECRRRHASDAAAKSGKRRPRR